MTATYLNQARSSTSGLLVKWKTTGAPDFAGSSFPGPGTPQHIAVEPLGTPLVQIPAAPHRMPIDGSTQLRWKFEESASPYVNDGAMGTAQNMVNVTGDGTVYKGGEPDDLFGKSLKFSMSTIASGALRAAHAAWPTSNITISIWITPTRLLGSSNFGEIFLKAANVTFATPFLAADIYFDVNGLNSLLRDASSLPASPANVMNYNPQGLTLNRPHLIVVTHGDGNLKTYIDGYLAKSAASAITMDLKTGPWCIGNFNAATQHCGGIYHEVRVCSVVRNAAWVLENWQRGKGIYAP